MRCSWLLFGQFRVGLRGPWSFPYSYKILSIFSIAEDKRQPKKRKTTPRCVEEDVRVVEGHTRANSMGWRDDIAIPFGTSAQIKFEVLPFQNCGELARHMIRPLQKRHLHSPGSILSLICSISPLCLVEKTKSGNSVAFKNHASNEAKEGRTSEAVGLRYPTQNLNFRGAFIVLKAS